MQKKDPRLSVKAYEWIKEAILKNRFHEGEPLSENRLAQELDISRTPVREVLRQLEREGFVRLVPGKGAFVAEISLEDVKEIYEIRVHLEPLAARSAVHRITEGEIDELQTGWKALLEKIEAGETAPWGELNDLDGRFHSLIVARTANGRLRQILETFFSQIQRFQLLSACSLADARNSVGQHLEILEALRNRDEEVLHELLTRHIRQSERYIFERYLKP
ncbi:GntR family transcriptional regulator [Aminirod propionatiphilus]|uniref:GntR family transcriptional regulator n=1 Tax=Aminirod propionatiphilus TaxID=3415223 RepID=A0ACD1DVW3_9BACT|nr:GntR family transcriptional regulator [Synergistota bacterium]